MVYHILIVDDETAIKRGLSMLIQRNLPDCIIDGTASDGIEAMEMIKKSPPDIVITDIKMPLCNGLELSRFLYEHYPEIKIIVLTGFADFAFAQTAIQYRVNDFLLKPTSREKLVESITKVQKEIRDQRKKRDFLQQNSSLYQERALQEIASGSAPDTYQQNALPILFQEREPYCCISFQCRDADGAWSHSGFQIRSILEEHLGSSGVFRYNNAVNCIYPQNTSIQEDPRAAISFARKIIDVSRILYSISLSAGISSKKSSILSLAEACQEANTALLSGFFSGEANIFLPTVRDSGNGQAMDVQGFLQQLEKSLQERQYNQSASLIGELFAEFQQKHASSYQVKLVSGQVYYILSRVLMQKDLSEKEPGFLHVLEHGANAEVLQEKLLQMLRQIQETVAQSPSQMIRNTTAFIAAHLAEELSLESIAEAVNANPSYLSRVFKREQGETLTEYITKARIEKAKTLLQMPDSLIYHVADAVGFRDAAYFSTLFKKYVGVSPKGYKQRHMK